MSRSFETAENYTQSPGHEDGPITHSNTGSRTSFTVFAQMATEDLHAKFNKLVALVKYFLYFIV